MSIVLQILLFVACLLTFAFVVRRIRRSQMQIRDAIFWIALSVILLVAAVVPHVLEWLAQILGVADPVNFVFLLIIFLLLTKAFSMAVQISRLDARINSLAQQIAVRETEHHNDVEGNQ